MTKQKVRDRRMPSFSFALLWQGFGQANACTCSSMRASKQIGRWWKIHLLGVWEHCEKYRSCTKKLSVKHHRLTSFKHQIELCLRRAGNSQHQDRRSQGSGPLKGPPESIDKFWIPMFDLVKYHDLEVKYNDSLGRRYGRNMVLDLVATSFNTNHVVNHASMLDETRCFCHTEIARSLCQLRISPVPIESFPDISRPLILNFWEMSEPRWSNVEIIGPLFVPHGRILSWELARWRYHICGCVCLIDEFEALS